MVEPDRPLELPLPELLARLVAHEASGTLDMVADCRRWIVLLDGEILGVRSSLEEEMLGSWLVGQSRISEGERALALLAQGGGELPLGRLLSGQGRIESGTIDDEIRSLWLTIIERAAAEPHLRCEFRVDDLADAGSGPTLINESQAVLTAARAFADFAAKRESIGSFDQAVWTAREMDHLLEELELTPTEAFLLSRLRGTDTVGNLIRQSSLAEEVAVSVVYGLRLAGLLYTGPTPHPVPAPEGTGGRPALKSSAGPEVDEASLDQDLLKERRHILDRAERAVRIDHYAALGVERSVTTEEVTLAWRLVERTFAPSRTAEPHLADCADELAIIVDRARDAHEVLSDPKARRRYDRILADIETEKIDLGRVPAQPETDPGARRAIVEANFERAEQLLAMGELYGAVQLLENACALEPRPAELVKLARLLLRNPQWTSRALRHLQHATEVDPRCVDAWLELAEFWRRKSDPDRQRRALNRALRVDPENARARRMLEALSVKKETRTFLDRLFGRD